MFNEVEEVIADEVILLGDEVLIDEESNKKFEVRGGKRGLKRKKIKFYIEQSILISYLAC